MTILDMAMQRGIRPKWVASTAGGEYHSECPECGGKDRFYIQPHKQMKNCKGYFCCRKCGTSGDAIQFARKFLNFTFEQAVQLLGVTLMQSSFQTWKPAYSFKPAILHKPDNKWIQEAENFVAKSHTELLNTPEKLKYLHDRGIPLTIIIKYKLGLSNSCQFIERSAWGLREELNQKGQLKKLFIPQGIVMPSIDKLGQILRLKIRRLDWQPNDKIPKYIAVSGSMNGLNILEGFKDVLIVVESELDAYLIYSIVSDLATIISVGGNIKNPDNVVDRLAKNSKKLLINHDNDNGGKAMLSKWQKLYSHAISCPIPVGKDISEALSMGFDVKSWLMKIVCN